MSEVCSYLITQVCVLCLVAIENSLSDLITVENKTCSMSVHVSEKTSETLKWDGRPLPRHCRVRFNVPNERDYKFIINVDQYQIEDCRFKMLYFDGMTAAPRKNYSCYSIPEQQIIEDENHIYMQFETYGKSGSKVKVKVSAEHTKQTMNVRVSTENPKEDDSGEESKSSVPPGWGSLFLVLLVLIIFIIYMDKKKCRAKCSSTCNECCGNCVPGPVEDCFAVIRGQLSKCPNSNCIRTSVRGNATVTDQSVPQQQDISFRGQEPTAPPITEFTSPDDPPPSYQEVLRDMPPPPSYSDHMV